MLKNETEKPDSRKILLLDGATGSELERRGIKIDLPLWSTHALLTRDNRRILREIHADYVKAGADVITANTFRTNRRALKKAGLEKQDQELTHIAVEEARRAIEDTNPDKPVLVAGSVATVEDCYRPDLVPSDQELTEEHRRHIDHLYQAGVDLILIETINSTREGWIALEYAKQTRLPVYISFICRDAHHLLNGEKLSAAVEIIQLLYPDALLVNCVPVNVIGPALLILKEYFTGPIGAYANITGTTEWSADKYAHHTTEWFHHGATIIGGCCGTTPDHIAALHRQWQLHQ